MLIQFLVQQVETSKQCLFKTSIFEGLVLYVLCTNNNYQDFFVCLCFFNHLFLQYLDTCNRFGEKTVTVC